MTLSESAALLGFVLVAALVASSGAVFRPGPWYFNLRKPVWTPLPWMFRAIWGPLFVAIALSGWLAWREAGFSTVPFTVYALQLLLNAAWSALFFGLRRADFALVDIVLLWLAIAGTVLAFAPISAVAAWLLVPYLVWVTVAATLNLRVWQMNQHGFSRA